MRGENGARPPTGDLKGDRIEGGGGGGGGRSIDETGRNSDLCG